MTLYNADCLDVMREMPDKSVDLIITDPPYGIKRDHGFKGAQGFGGVGTPIPRRQYEGEDWDNERPSREHFDEIIRISINQIIFGGNFFTDLLPQGNHWIVWDKQNTMPSFGDCEVAWTNIDRNSIKLFSHTYNGLIGKEKERIHPTQKPVKLFEWIIQNYSKEGDLICDPFFGSGSCLVAAVRLGHPIIGVEKEKSYFDSGKMRIEDAMKQGKLKTWGLAQA